MSYAELLRDPRWQRKRLEVMERDEFQCQECGSGTRTLNVHHTYYAKGRKPWEYEADALRTLCEECHKRLTDLLAETMRMLGALHVDSLALVVDALRASVSLDICAICGTHRGMMPGKLLCGSCSYNPFADAA